MIDDQPTEPIAPEESTSAAMRDEEPAPITSATRGTTPPRSLKRRIVQQETANRSGRVRSQPLNPGAAERPRRVREPVPLEWEPEPMSGPWRAKPYVIGAAVLAWIAAIGLLLMNPAQLGAAGLAPRLIVTLAWVLAAAITFIPMQFRLAIPGVGWQSMLGFGLLGYLLAFVPAPTGWLLDLPDLPVYLLFFFAIFYAVTAAVVPLTYLLGQRWYKLRIHRLDVGRARRQGYEAGLLLVVTLVMASLRVLSLVTFGLLALVIVLTEALLLSQVRPEG